MVGKSISGERARSGEDKEIRRQAVMEAALDLWDTQDFGQITMAEVARRSGLAKATLYVYFATKEELFLDILDQLLGRWFEDVQQALDAAATPLTTTELAALLTASVGRRERMIRLLSIGHGVLERNAAPEKILAFKLRLHAWLVQTGRHLEQVMPDLPAGSGTRLLFHLNALVIGLYAVTAATPGTVIAQQTRGLSTFTLDFGEELRYALAHLLSGIQNTTPGL